MRSTSTNGPTTADFREGVMSFVERRPPEFENVEPRRGDHHSNDSSTHHG